MPDPLTIPANRLFDAAEACVNGARAVAEATGDGFIWPPDFMGTPLQPPCLDDFTMYEVEEASKFLVRLGIFEKIP